MKWRKNITVQQSKSHCAERDCTSIKICKNIAGDVSPAGGVYKQTSPANIRTLNIECCGLKTQLTKFVSDKTSLFTRKNHLARGELRRSVEEPKLYVK